MIVKSQSLLSLLLIIVATWERNRPFLFPVRLGKTVFESPFDWSTEIRHERNIGDFTH